MKMVYVLRIVGLVAIVFGFIFAAGFVAKLLYAKPMAVPVFFQPGFTLASVYVKTPAIIEIDWNREVGPKATKLIDSFTKWSTMIVPGYSTNVSGGIYILVLNLSKPLGVTYRVRPWFHPVFFPLQGISGILLTGSGLLLWFAGGRFAKRLGER